MSARYVFLYLIFLGVMLPAKVAYSDSPYQVEVLGFYEKESADQSTEKAIAFGVQYFFEAVDPNNKPLAEAAFLDKKGSLSVGYIDTKTDYINSSLESLDLGGPLVMLNYIVPGSSFIIGARYASGDGSSVPELVNIDTEVVGFSIGKYISHSTAIELSYDNTEADYTDTSSNLIGSLDVDAVEINIKTVQWLPDNKFYSFEIGYEVINKDNTLNSTKEDNSEISIDAGIYLSRMTSINFGVAFNSGDDVDDEGQTYGLKLLHFINPQIAIQVGLSAFNPDNRTTEDTDTIEFGVLARF